MLPPEKSKRRDGEKKGKNNKRKRKSMIRQKNREKLRNRIGKGEKKDGEADEDMENTV